MKKIKQFRRNQPRQIREAAVIPVQNEDVRNFRKIYLDDERPCPPGWVLVKNSTSLFNILDGEHAAKVQLLSLDWYLGVGVYDGEKIATLLAERFRTDPQFLPSLQGIVFHSSDRTAARRMLNTVFDAVPIDRRADIGFTF